MSDGFRILEGIINFTSKRHGVITSNIANADTPNYKAKDIRFERVLSGEIMELKTTNSKHLKAEESNLDSSEEVTVERPSLMDKNNVVLDMEVAKMTENALLFQAGITLLSTKIRMFKNALRRS